MHEQTAAEIGAVSEQSLTPQKLPWSARMTQVAVTLETKMHLKKIAESMSREGLKVQPAYVIEILLDTYNRSNANATG